MMDTESAPQNKQKRKTKPFSKSFPGITLRIFLVLLTGGVIGAVVYFSAVGWVPYLEQRILEPIQNNRDRAQELEATQVALADQLSFLSENLGENQFIQNRDLEAAIAAADEKIDQLEAAVETLTAFGFTQMPALISTLTADQQANQNHISILATAQMEYIRSGSVNELITLNALLSRANQYLLHDNYGLAEDQLIIAQQILQAMVEGQSGSQMAQTLELLGLIEGALEDLPDQVSLASVKLDLAWQLTLGGFEKTPGQTLDGTPSPTLPITVTPTPK